jgi:hypothetical protein
MADTVRTLAELLTLLADNTTGAISEQDMRDVVVSLSPAHGGMYISSAVETSIAASSTDGSNAVKALGTTTAFASLNDMDMPANNRLRYTGAANRLFTVQVAISTIAAANSKVFGWYIAKNGTVIAESLISRKQGTGADVGALALHWQLELAQNDYIEVFLEDRTDTTNAPMSQMVMLMEGQNT